MSKHILVIDDDPVLLAMVSDFLKDAGYDVSTADCGIYSNNIIYGPNPPDLIVLDVIMPLMSGVKKAKLLKQREKSAHIPIILMSSKEPEELQVAGARKRGHGQRLPAQTLHPGTAPGKGRYTLIAPADRLAVRANPRLSLASPA